MGDSKKKAGQLIRKVRKQKELTQQELGERLGVSRVVVSDYERGEQNLTLDTLDKVAEALGVKVNILLE